MRASGVGSAKAAEEAISIVPFTIIARCVHLQIHVPCSINLSGPGSRRSLEERQCLVAGTRGG